MDNINIDPETLEIQAPDYTAEIVEILKSNLTPKALKDKIMDYHDNDIAAAMDLLEEDERRKLYHILDAQTLSDILKYLLYLILRYYSVPLCNTFPIQYLTFCEYCIPKTFPQNKDYSFFHLSQ